MSIVYDFPAIKAGLRGDDWWEPARLTAADIHAMASGPIKPAWNAAKGQWELFGFRMRTQPPPPESD